MDLLLVLGSVTTKQYTPVRKAMLARGLKPQVVRVGTQLSLETDFLSFLLVQARTSKVPLDDLDDYFDVETKKLKQHIIEVNFGAYSVDDVKAIVHEPVGLHEDYISKMQWLTRLLPNDIPEYTVMTLNDGSDPWLEGTGYGDLKIR
jgi:hypothetical protein